MAYQDSVVITRNMMKEVMTAAVDGIEDSKGFHLMPGANCKKFMPVPMTLIFSPVDLLKMHTMVDLQEKFSIK